MKRGIYKRFRIEQTTIDATSEDHIDQTKNSRGVQLHDQHSRTGSMDDLQKIIRVEQTAVDVTFENHFDRTSCLKNRGVELKNRYSRTKAMTDLETVIQRFQEALNLMSTNHFDRVDQFWKNDFVQKKCQRIFIVVNFRSFTFACNIHVYIPSNVAFIFMRFT